MPLILNQQRYALEFDDIIGDRYHYPEQYASYIQTGEIFIYYHPSEKPLDPHIYYFGLSTVRGKHTRPLGELRHGIDAGKLLDGIGNRCATEALGRWVAWR